MLIEIEGQEIGSRIGLIHVSYLAKYFQKYFAVSGYWHLA